MKPILYSSWSSSCSSRVSIALALKKIDYDYHPTHLDTEEDQKQFALCNPAKKIPILKINGLILTESLAIIEYLDEVYPEPPLLPKEPKQRAHARAIAFHIASNIQPLQSRPIRDKLNLLEQSYGNQCCHNVITFGFDALEKLLEMYSGNYCVGDHITIADLNLPSIVYNAVNKCHVDMTPYPNIVRIDENLAEVPEFRNAQPYRQPDAPKK